MRTNFHTHHYLCRHAYGHVEDYVREAISKNIKILGFSDHAPIPNAYFKRMSVEEMEDIYLKEIKDAQIKYRNQIKIYSGLEAEYFYENVDYSFFLSKVDYLILGAHFDGGYFNHLGSSYEINTREKLFSYMKVILDGLNTGHFKILAHPDLFMVGYPVFDKYCELCSRKIIEAAIQNQVVLEYNANGKRRGRKVYTDGSVGYGYPNEHFFRLVKEYPSAKVIVSSDCHKPEDLYDEMMEESFEDLKKIGIVPIESIF